MKYFHQIAIASIVYLIIFLLNYIYELFQITKTSEVTTLLGLNIKTTITPEELETIFSVTWRMGITYISFVAIWLCGYCIITRLATNQQPT
ncbi:MAG: hypothetical protein LBT80_05475 [Lactobacillaceae bacterium]|jgi:cellulose synthase/poly-beta-1,6-N-acetylglucosamine synthase-like glycosyltransferase|nr:hypothetical protein [Lactobacillaceae bacterium]